MKGKGLLISALLLALAMPFVAEAKNNRPVKRKPDICEVVEEEQRKADEAEYQLKERIPKLKFAKSYMDSLKILYKGALDYPVRGYLSSKFGYRKQPLEKNIGGLEDPEEPLDFHPAIDIAVPKRTPLKSPFNAEIFKGAYDSHLGWYLKMRLKSGTKIKEPVLTFGHLFRLSQKYLDATEENPIEVKKGEWILETYNSGGFTTGPHVHYAIQIGEDLRFVDPQIFYNHRYKKKQKYGEE